MNAFAHRLPARLAAVILLALTPYVLAAQEASRPDSLSYDFVMGIMSAGYGLMGELRVGQVGERFPVELLPAGSEILGSVSSAQGSMTIVRVLQPPRAALSALEDRLTAGGWSRPAPPPSGEYRNVFEPSEQRTIGGYSRQGFCKGQEGLMPFSVRPPGRTGREAPALPGARPATLQATLLRIQHTPPGESSMCSPRPLRMAIAAYLPELTLRAPIGMEVDARGSSYSNDSQGSEATITGALNAAEIAAHYGAQIREAGWELVGESADTLAASQTWRIQNQNGRWRAVFSVIAVADSPVRHAELRISRY